MGVVIGSSMGSPLSPKPTRFFTEDADLAPFCHLPCVHAEVAKRHGLTFSTPVINRTQPITIEDSNFERHGLLTGPTGAGKTRLLRLLLAYRLCQGDSVFILEPKVSTVREYLSLARTVGIPPERVFVLSPSIPGATPRWPLFSGRLPVKQIVDTFVDLVESSVSAQTAIRRHDFLVNFGLLVGSADRNNSVDEWLNALQEPDYRDALMGQVKTPSDPFAWNSVQRFISEVQQMSKAAVADSVAPATRLLRELANNELLFGCLCALNDPTHSILNLERFWQDQSLLIIHLDADVAGMRSTALLAGLVVRALFATAKHVKNSQRSVIACLDELPEVSRFIGGDLARIASQARSARLHLLLACQHLSQLQTDLRETLSKQCSIQINFRCEYEDAVGIAQAITAGVVPPISQVTLTPLRTTDSFREIRMAAWRLAIFDENDNPLQIRREVWDGWVGKDEKFELTLVNLQRHTLNSGISRLYIHDPETQAPIALERYLSTIEECEYWFEGPRLLLAARFPRARAEHIVHASRAEITASVAHCIESLPNRTALLRLDNQVVGVFRVADVPDLKMTREDDQYIQEVLNINGQTREMVLATLKARSEGMKQVVDGSLTQSSEGELDESKW